MFELLSSVDSDIFLFFNNGFRSPFFDRLMMNVTGRFVWIPMYAAILFLFLRTQRWKHAIVVTLALAAAVAITDQACATLIRPLVERLRPSNLENPLSAYTCIVGNYRGGAYGFPSCHAANSFTLAIFMTLLVRKRTFGIFIIGWAVLNSYSRLYLGVHYPGDLLVGAVIGGIVGWGCYAAVSYFIKIGKSGAAVESGHPALVLPAGMQDLPALRVRPFALTADATVMAVGTATALVIVLVSI